jgi:hypothetical protein
VTVFDPTNSSPGEIDRIYDRLRDERLTLPLDGFIRNLSKRTKKPILRNLAGNQFTFARLAVNDALAEGCLSAQGRIFSEMTTVHLAPLTKILKRVTPQLEEAVRRIAQIREVQIVYPDLDAAPFEDLARALLTIKDVTPLLRQLYEQRRQNAGDVWRINFVGGLFGPWRELTGGNPQPSGPFLEFVEAAWHSFSPDQPDVPFERPIRTAKSRCQDCRQPVVSGPSLTVSE